MNFGDSKPGIMALTYPITFLVLVGVATTSGFTLPDLKKAADERAQSVIGKAPHPLPQPPLNPEVKDNDKPAASGSRETEEYELNEQEEVTTDVPFTTDDASSTTPHEPKPRKRLRQHSSHNDDNASNGKQQQPPSRKQSKGPDGKKWGGGSFCYFCMDLPTFTS